MNSNEDILEDIDISDRKIILSGDLNLVFDCNVEACGGNPVLKKKSLSLSKLKKVYATFGE